MQGNKPPAGQAMVIVAIVTLIAAGSAITVMADSRSAAFTDVGGGAFTAQLLPARPHELE